LSYRSYRFPVVIAERAEGKFEGGRALMHGVC
jgi:hypothetical protein